MLPDKHLDQNRRGRAQDASALCRAPRADGQPDLQGIWSNATITPLERPADLAGKPTFTPEEAAAYEKKVVERNNVDHRARTPTPTWPPRITNFGTIAAPRP